MIYFKNI